MPKPENERKTSPPREPPASGRGPAPSATPREPAGAPRFTAPHGISGEAGWLPDCVFTGDKFESGLAFFADAMGRITRFSREPTDLAAARRLAGQAALPGLVNTHSHAFHRVLRGRTELRGRAERDSLATWRETHDHTVAHLTADDVFDTARMAFMEMLLSGITCVGEFHYLHHQADGSPWPDPNYLAREVLRAAHDVGIRIALLQVASTRADFGAAEGSTLPRVGTANVDLFLRNVEALRVAIAVDYPDDEAWLGVAAHSLAALPIDRFKAIATYAHAKRMRLHAHVAMRAEETAACQTEFGRTPVALLAEHGLIDKRFTAVHALHLTDDEAKLLGAARAIVCACPLTEHNLGLGVAPLEKLLAAGAGLAVGSDGQGQIDLLKEARLVEYHWRAIRRQHAVVAPDAATALFHAATTGGARSLGATGGALEIGRPADFFTVNLYEPSLAGADAASLLANIVFGLERRAVREVWVGARRRIENGRHPNQGPIVGRFVDLQKRLWPA